MADLDLAFVGLGGMGSRLAKRLLNSGYRMTGYNRTAKKAQDLAYMGMRVAATPREAAAAADVVFTMVSDNAALIAVTDDLDGGPDMAPNSHGGPDMAPKPPTLGPPRRSRRGPR